MCSGAARCFWLVATNDWIHRIPDRVVLLSLFRRPFTFWNPVTHYFHCWARPQGLHLHVKNPEYNLEVSINAYLVGIIPWGIGLSLMWLFGMSLFDLPTVLGLSAGYVVATYVLFSFLRKWEKTGKLTEENAPSLRKNLLVVFILLLIPVFLGGYYGQLTAQLVSLIVWQLVISGFGEEAFWRGYVQTRLNEGFGKPFEFMGVSFGWGLILTSFLFGLFHVLNPFNPFVGSFEINILWGVFTFFGGLFLGLIREKTGSLIATGVAHGLLDAVGEGIGLVLGL